jgi:hypothetical protein
MAQDTPPTLANMTPEYRDALYAQMAEAQGTPVPAGPPAPPPLGEAEKLTAKINKQNPPTEMTLEDLIAKNSAPVEEKSQVGPSVIQGTAKPPPDTGLAQSFFGAFNDAVLYLPDAAINRAVQALEITGLIDAPKDERLNRNFLQRTFNAADYKTKQEIAGTIFNLGDPTGAMGVRNPYASAAGEAAAMGAGFAGALTGTALRTADQLRRFAAGNPNTFGASAEVLAAEAARAPRGAPLPVGARGAALEGVEAPAGWTTQRLMDPTQNVLDRIGSSMAAPFAASPVGATIGEIAGNIAGGVTGEAEKEYTPLRTSSGQPIVTGIPGMLTGMYGGALAQEPLQTLKATINSLPIATYQAGRKLYTFADGQIRQMTNAEVAEQKMKESMRSAFERATAASEEKGILPRTREIEQTFEEAGVGAPQYSYAERTLDPFAASTQTVLQKKATDELARANISRFENNIQKAYDFFAKMIPDMGDAPMQVFTDRWEAAKNLLGQHVEGMRNAAQEELSKILEKFPAVNQAARVERGRAIQEQIDTMKQTAKENLLELATTLKLDKPQGRPQIGDLQASLAERFKPSATTDDRLPGVIRDLRDLDSNTMNFQDYLRFREDLGSALGSAAARGGRGKEITDLEFAKKQLDNWAENAFGPNYATWRDRWMREYVAPFENGLVYKLTERQFTRPDMPVKYQLQGEMVADEIVKQAQRGKIDDFNNYLDLIQRDPAAMNNVRNAFLDDILAKVYNPQKGEINPFALKAYAKDNEVYLNRLGMRDEVNDISSATDALSQRLTGLKERESVIKKDQLIKTFDAMKDKGQTTEEFVDGLLKNPDKLGQFWSRLKEPGPDGKVDQPLLDAFRGVTMNRVAATMSKNNPEAFIEGILQYAPAMKRIMTPDELDKYILVNDALYRAAFASANMTTAGIIPSSTVQMLEKALGTKLPSIGSYLRAMEANKQSAVFLGGLLTKNFLTAKHQAAFEEVQRKALFDKDFVDLLATPVRRDGSVPMPAERKLRSYMFESLMPNIGQDRNQQVDVTYDPVQGGFIRMDNGQPLSQKGKELPPQDRGIPLFENMGPPPMRPQVPVQIPTVAPAPVSPAPAPVSTPAPTQTTPPQPRPLDIRGLPPAQQNQTPGKQGMIYQNMFPNDPLGSLLAAKRAG